MFLKVLVIHALPEKSVMLSLSNISGKSKDSYAPNQPSCFGGSGVSYYSIGFLSSFAYFTPTEVLPLKQSRVSSSTPGNDGAALVDVGSPRASQSCFGVSTRVDTLLQIIESCLQKGRVSAGFSDWSINAS